MAQQTISNRYRYSVSLDGDWQAICAPIDGLNMRGTITRGDVTHALARDRWGRWFAVATGYRQRLLDRKVFAAIEKDLG